MIDPAMKHPPGGRVGRTPQLRVWINVLKESPVHYFSGHRPGRAGVRAEEVVVADERRLRHFGKVGIVSEALKLRLVENGP